MTGCVSMAHTLDHLLNYVRAGERICPLPQMWSRLWEMLPGKARVGAGWRPPAPLILAAWHHTNDDEKVQRLREHIEYAASQGCLDPVDTFLRALQEDEWHCRGD